MVEKTHSNLWVCGSVGNRLTEGEEAREASPYHLKSLVTLTMRVSTLIDTMF